MTVQSTFFDGDTCRVLTVYPGSTQHLAAKNPSGEPVVVGYDEVSKETLSQLSFHELAANKHKLFRANGKWHAEALC